MKHTFFICGLTGWCLEIIYTSLHSIRRKDYRLIGNTSIWMFPIYGMTCFLNPVFKLLKGKNILLRGGVYTFFIFTGEYLTGSILRKIKACPWDYSNSRSNIHGLIRLDYAPLWFCTGILYEKILCKH